MTLTTKVCTLPQQGETHQHPHHQLVLGIRGAAEFEIDGRGARVSTQQGCIAPGSVLHAYVGQQDNHMMVIDLPPQPAPLLSAQPEQAMLERLFEQPTYFDIDSALRQFLCFSVHELTHFGDDPLLQRHISNTIVHSLHQRLFGERYSARLTPARSGLDMAVLDQFIQDHLHQKLSVQQLAALVHLSSSHFHALFKQTTGHSPHQYLLQARLNRARQLLQESDIALVDIAQQCGFSSQSALSHALKQHLGETPSRLRRASRL